ncbi:MAG: insulinase family protein [Bacteroidales bacterium]|nr:insulinase family protein [Bacteroidales bacterium]
MRKTFLTIAAVLCSAFALVAQDPASQQLPLDPAVRKGVLDNGMTYYIRHNALPEGRAEFYLATNVGAIQEAPDQDGLAHFLEHMCFNGTKNFPDKGILDYLQSIGASFGGNVNASTGVEQTVYMLNNIPLLRPSVIDTCILIMHDYSHFVTNDPVEIDKERGVILEEKRTRNSASWRMREKSGEYIYGDSKYATTTVIGTEEHLKTFKPESLVAFYETWCRPDLQALIVVGDVDADYTENKIKEIFSDIPAPVDPRPKDVIKVPDNAEPIVGIVTDPEATGTSVNVIWKSEPMPEIMNNTISGVMVEMIKNLISSIMRERLDDIAAAPNAPFLNGFFYITDLCETVEAIYGGVSSKEGDAVNAFKAYYTECEKLRRFGFNDDEVERAKTEMLSQYERAVNEADTRKSPELVYELINNFFDNSPVLGPEMEYELAKQILPMVNAQILSQVAAQTITEDNLVVVYQAPEKAGLSHPSKEDFLKAIEEVRASDIKANEGEAIPEAFLNPAALKGAPVKKTQEGIHGSTVWTLKNGVKVILYPSDFEKDRIVINAYKPGGTSIIAEKDLPSFDSNIIALFQENSGVSSFSGTVKSKMLAGKQANASAYFYDYRHGIRAWSTVKDLETAFQILYLQYVDPRFDQSEYDKGIATLEAVIPNFVNQPNYKFSQRALETLYGKNNPRHAMIDESTLKNASLQTIERVYRKQLFKDAGGLTVIITGDFTPEGIKPLVEKYIGSLPKGKAGKWVDNNAEILPGRRTVDFKVPMEAAKVTVAHVYSAPMNYSFANEVALDAASYILDMRYVTSLREEEGGTYGAHSSADLSIIPQQIATLQISFDTNPESADKLRELAVAGLKELAEQGPTPEEFDMAVKNMLKNLPENRITNNYWGAVLRQKNDYGFDADVEKEKAINNLKISDVKDVLTTLLGSGNFCEIVMRAE